MADPKVESKPKPGLSGVQKLVLIGLVLVLVGSAVSRAARDIDQPAVEPAPAGATGLVEDGGLGAAAEPEGLERFLPYLTEASFFGLIGFALGYASRKLVKAALIVIALAFVGLQVLVWTDTVTIDWGGLVGKVNGWLMNLRQNEPVTAFLTKRVPSAATLLVAYLIGFKRG
jgi:uncharacterized membrane protein (Fun14 family)